MTADARVVALDVLVVGGGVQGLVLLHELRGAGYSVALVTDADLGAGQTLHAHGILNTGYPFPRRDLRASLERDWLPFAARTGLELYGSDAFFMAPPATARDELIEAWTELGYEHTSVEPEDVPIGLRNGLLGAEAAARRLVRIREYTYPKRQLVERLSGGQEHRILRGTVTAFHCSGSVAPSDAQGAVVERVTVRGSDTGAQVALRPAVVILAAGTGMPGLVRQVTSEPSFGDASGRDRRVADGLRAQAAMATFRSIHMICLRAPRAVLPAVNVFLPDHGLTIATADVDGPHDRVDGESRRTWYVTPVDPGAEPAGDVPSTAEAVVDRRLVGEGLKRLLRLVPTLDEAARRPESGVDVAVYAGYKQDIGSERNRPVFEPLDGLCNVAMAFPSLMAGSWVNAHAAHGWVRTLVPVPAGETAIVGAGAGVRTGDVSENGPAVP